MNTLVIYAHPNPTSFCQALTAEIARVLEAGGHAVRIRDLYALGFEPVLQVADFEAFAAGRVPEDIAAEQAQIRWAEVLVFVYPMWWYGWPAILKGYIDRVFSHGFAYEDTPTGPRGLLAGKAAFVVQTAGATDEVLASTRQAEVHRVAMDEGTLGFNGITTLGHVVLGGIGMASPAARTALLQQTAGDVAAAVATRA